jgi:hypothetical protein
MHESKQQQGNQREADQKDRAAKAGIYRVGKRRAVADKPLRSVSGCLLYSVDFMDLTP